MVEEDNNLDNMNFQTEIGQKLMKIKISNA